MSISIQHFQFSHQWLKTYPYIQLWRFNKIRWKVLKWQIFKVGALFLITPYMIRVTCLVKLMNHSRGFTHLHLKSLFLWATRLIPTVWTTNSTPSWFLGADGMLICSCCGILGCLGAIRTWYMRTCGASWMQISLFWCFPPIADEASYNRFCKTCPVPRPTTFFVVMSGIWCDSAAGTKRGLRLGDLLSVLRHLKKSHPFAIHSLPKSIHV